MTPELRALVEHAAARRAMLIGLVDAIPADGWSRQAPGDEWNARRHLDHVATVDGLLQPFVTEAARGAGTVWLGGAAPGALERLRLAAADEAGELAIPEVLARMRHERAGMTRAIADLPPSALECAVCVHDANGEARSWPLRQYLGYWAEHDTEHESAIRAAIRTSPDLAAVMLARRRSG